MSTPVTRREAIRTLSAAGAGAAFAFESSASALEQGAPVTTSRPNPSFPAAPAWKTELRELAPGVFAYIQGGGPDVPNVSISNAALVAGPDALLAIDALAAPFHAKAFIAAARQATNGKPFRRLINTHHHSDHTAGNQFFMPVEIISHTYCRDEVAKMAAANTAMLWQKRDGWADGSEERRIVVPDVTFSSGTRNYQYGSTQVELQFVGPAHTYGDVMVYLPQHRILFAGDVAFHYVAPFAQNAHVTKWIETVDRIVGTMAVDVVVPGHGPIGTKHELAEMGDYFKLLKREARRRYDAKMSPGRAAADISMGKFENWIGPERIVMDTVRLYAEFAGTLTPDVDADGNRQATEEYNTLKSARPARPA
jgi:cyclase